MQFGMKIITIFTIVCLGIYPLRAIRIRIHIILMAQIDCIFLIQHATCFLRAHISTLCATDTSVVYGAGATMFSTVLDVGRRHVWRSFD